MWATKLQEQQDIKPTSKQFSAEARIAAFEAQPRINSHLEEGNVVKEEGNTHPESAWERNRWNPMVTCKASGDKHKEPG